MCVGLSWVYSVKFCITALNTLQAVMIKQIKETYFYIENSQATFCLLVTNKSTESKIINTTEQTYKLQSKSVKHPRFNYIFPSKISI